MSEYQYYEFRTIDRPLTDEQKEELSSLSSRAYVTSHQASFVYHYGDFRGDEKQLMTAHFDMMLYMANWGSRRLMFRIPSSLIDIKQVAHFCISEEIDHWSSEDKRNIILDLNFYDEEQADWTEGEGWLDELINLREELIQGDFRILYLAWLKAAENALKMEETDKDLLEPPVPDGLRQLSNAQKAYVRFLDIDEAMITVAARQSEQQQNEAMKAEDWIGKLSKEEKHEFLLRLSLGEMNLSILLNRRLHALATKQQAHKEKKPAEKRTIAFLVELSEKWRQQKEEEQRKKAEHVRKKKLQAKTIHELFNSYIGNKYTSEDFIRDEIRQSLSKLIITTSQKEEWFQFIQEIATARVDHIVSNKHRKAYARAAEAMGGYMECLILNDQKNKAIDFLDLNRNQKFNRFPAFRAEVDSVLRSSPLLIQL
ncbi:MAG: hypothetical protein O7D86_14280 [Proteobacteria bacterium]|nr:hypothetical protein [Pseudomonadota bacterium]